MFEKIISSKKRLGLFLFVATALLSIPFTLSLLARQQDLRQHADDGGFGDICLDCQLNGDGGGSPPLGGGGIFGGGGTVVGGVGGGGTLTCDQLAQQNGASSMAAYCSANGGLCPSTANGTCGCTSCAGGTGGSATGAGGSQQNTTGALTNCTVDNSYIAVDSDEQSEVDLINQYRQQNGLPALPLSLALTRDAAWMTKDMGDKNYFSHTDSAGRSWDTRASQCGYPDFAADILDAGTGNITPQSTLVDWQNSPGHDKVIKDHIDGTDTTYDWKAIGIAHYTASNGQTYWDAVFGLTNDGGVVPTIAATPTPTNTPTPTSHPTATPIPTQAGLSPTQSQSNPTATPIVQQSPTATPTLAANSSAISINFTLPGIGGNQNAGENSNPMSYNLPTEIAVYDLSGNKLADNNLTASYNSTTFIYNLQAALGAAAGTYDFKIRTASSLWKDIGTVTVSVGQVANGGTVALITGDLTQDNSLDLADYNAIISCYGDNPCANPQAADLNMDGIVDERDLNIFYSGLSARQGD
ncbi:MAG TPA: CAP domain-containing protein [Patescibacteria group bacterium]|nr:CAP domain-containing protein [Patescibacteria group bacterium]